MKNKETLEEAAKRLIQDYNGDISQKLIAYTFITVGAKWQQEQEKNKYSEKQMDDAYDKGFKDASERMYSEEEVKNIIDTIVEKHCTYFEQKIKDGVKLEWFEKFKKK